VRAILTTDDGIRPRRRRARRIVALTVVAATCGFIHSGASWGSSAYDPAADPYSMQNVTQADGVQSWWSAGYTGKGVDVALIDTGVAPVPALSGNGKIVNGPDLSLESQNPRLRYLDTNGHGTFMAGIIGGNDGQPGGYRGVAPDSRILSVKVGDADGGVDVSQVIAAIDWVVQHRYDNGMNIRVINLSYGTNSSQPFNIDPLAYAVEQAWKAGIVVVTAAGNSGFGSGMEDPAYDPWVIAVGAADTQGTPTMADDQPAGFSAGPAGCTPASCRMPDLLAPGAHMQSLRDPGSYIDQNNPSAVLGDRYFRGSGTSEAAAYVTGTVALLLQRYPQLTPSQVKQMLDSSADTLRGYSPLWQGNGELDLNALAATPLPSSGPGGSAASSCASGPGGPAGPTPLAGPSAFGGPAGPAASTSCLWSTGAGSLEASRGTNHLTLNGVVLQGEQDIFGQPFNARGMAALEANESSWSGGMWNGSQWTGNSWSGNSWSGNSWSGNSWSGNSWSGNSWSGSSWSGNSWSGNSWSGNSWSGNSWSGNSWSGNSWSGSSWSGDEWLGASWG
jgi:serine protease AprX